MPPMNKAMLKTKPICEDDWETALTVLGRGFKHNDREFWQRGLRRHQTVTPDDLHWPIGHLLWDGDRAVGIMLAFRSKRTGQDGAEYAVANLAGWFLDEDYRWYAPFMLKNASRDQNVIYTDLTPLDSVEEMLKKLRWAPINGGIAFFSFIQGLAFWNRTGRTRTGRVTDFDPSADYGLPNREHDLLSDHARIGCVTAILQGDDGSHPLIFTRQSYRFIPYLGLIYARDRAIVLNNMASISRYLLRRGHFLASVDCFRDDVPFGGLFLDRRNTRKYYKGPASQKGIDYAYSELVFLFA